MRIISAALLVSVMLFLAISCPAAALEEVGNKTCPVTGEKIVESSKAIYEYNGKAYNLCCAMCINEFKKDPEKYAAKAEKEASA